MTAPTLPVIVELPSDSLTTRTPGAALDRVQRIAAIHAIAEHLAEHPELPVPHSIDLWVHDWDITSAEADAKGERLGAGDHRIKLPVDMPASRGGNGVQLRIIGLKGAK